MMSGILLVMVLSICICWFHNVPTLTSCLISVNLVHSHTLYNFTPISLRVLNFGWSHTLSCLLMYSSCANIGHADIMHYIVLLLLLLLFLLLLLLCYCLWSQAFSSRCFTWTSGDPHHSGFQFHTAVLSVLCVMFLV
jgi:hypothetical protein